MDRSRRYRTSRMITILGKLSIAALILALAPLSPNGYSSVAAEDANDLISDDTATCIDCHMSVTPGIVSDWQRSRHAAATVARARTLPPQERRVSADVVPTHLATVSVGCAECHGQLTDGHSDAFEHNGYAIHVVVTPRDCAVCHPAEVEQYAQNLMSYAYPNLAENALYMQLVESGSGLQRLHGSTLETQPPSDTTYAEGCFYCHGTRVTVTGSETRDTELGTMEFPRLNGWPSQGVGRINPDGSRGCCSSCHTRHRFSIAMARKPATCAQCHKGPDVPAYKVYGVSKHGNLYAAQHAEWDFTAVPWIPGEHFSAPTCATCHVSLLVTGDGEIAAARTHRMNDRSAWRLFGLPYAHPHPRSANTTIIRNRAGLPLPTELTGEPVSEFLIDEVEMTARSGRMQRICGTCHSTSWIEPLFARTEHTIAETNAMTLAATDILQQAWEQGLASGPAQGGSPFDENIEKMWVAQWLFYANSVRFASAMVGADYGSFANGRWNLSENLRRMHDWLAIRTDAGSD